MSSNEYLLNAQLRREEGPVYFEPSLKRVKASLSKDDLRHTETAMKRYKEIMFLKD